MASVNKQVQKKRFVICEAETLNSGERLLVHLDGKSIGVFNVNGDYFALLNYCPHKGGALCEGPIAGTALPTDERQFVYGHEDAILRCAWHGWEFDVRTGRYLVNPKIRARTYHVEVEKDQLVVYI